MKRRVVLKYSTAAVNQQNLSTSIFSLDTYFIILHNYLNIVFKYRGVMLKNILSAIAGYFTIALTLFITFTIVYLILGTEGSFRPGTYEVSALWVILSIIISFGAAYMGGFVATTIPRNAMAAYVLAGLVFTLGLIMAFLSVGSVETGMTIPREGDVDNFEAMQNAVTPLFIQFLNPFIGAVGVLYGARKYSTKLPA
jgi:hypothetical protein